MHMVIKDRKGLSSYIKVVVPSVSDAEESDDDDDSDEESSAPAPSAAPSAAQRRHLSQRGSEVTLFGGLHVGNLQQSDARTLAAAFTTLSVNEASTQAERAMQQ
eukprot:6192705-Pleurochrysis_carterae.AAC.2